MIDVWSSRVMMGALSQKSMSPDAWGKLGHIFDPSGENPHVADNMFAADKLFEWLPPSPKRGLDFGCGTAWMAAELQRRSYDMEGLERSPGLLGVAQRNFGDQMQLTLGDEETLQRLHHFDFIISMMVLQFLERLDRFGEAAHRATQGVARLLFAVHNPDYVVAAADRSGMSIHRQGSSFVLQLGGGPVRIYARTSEVFADTLAATGWNLESHCPFALPPAFHARFPNSEEPQDFPPKFHLYSFQRN